MKRSLTSTLALTFVLTAPAAPHALRAEDGQGAALVIEGGTLIDGNGGAPMKDVQIVVEGNKITHVGRKGQPVPAAAQVIHADGKFIVPGLIDSLVNYKWYDGEIFLNNGITSAVGMGDLSVGGVLYMEGTRRGKIRAPRLIDWPVNLGTLALRTGLEGPFVSTLPVHTAAEAREATQRALGVGGQGITFMGVSGADALKAAIEVAHAAGKPVGVRAMADQIDPKQVALLGADFLPRSSGVAEYVAGPARAPGDDELATWAKMDDARAADLVKVLAKQKTALIPAYIGTTQGLPSGWSQFELQTRRMFADPFLASYFPVGKANFIVWNAFFDLPNLRPDVVGIRRKGFQNMLRFHRMLVEAGGHVLAGTDGGNFTVPGVGIDFELQTMVEDGGIKPMQALQGATKWAAEALRLQDQLGTVETGKLADILIVNANPLANIRNLQDVAAVVADGHLQDLRFHGDYWSPFGGDDPVIENPVEDLRWALDIHRRALAARQIEGAPRTSIPVGGPGAATAPAAMVGYGSIVGMQPTIETIDSGRQDYADPDFSKVVVKELGPSLTLKMTGFNYFQRSQVYFNGIPVPTRVMSRSSLEATLDESLLRAPGRYSLVVKNLTTAANPADTKQGESTSNRAWLFVGYK